MSAMLTRSLRLSCSCALMLLKSLMEPRGLQMEALQQHDQRSQRRIVALVRYIAVCL